MVERESLHKIVATPNPMARQRFEDQKLSKGLPYAPISKVSNPKEILIPFFIQCINAKLKVEFPILLDIVI